MRKIKKLFFYIFAIIGLLYSLNVIYYAFFPDQYFKFKFSSSEDGSPINGEVYLNGIYLGETKNGILKANISDLESGELMLKGIYQGKQFEMYWDFKGEAIQNGEQEYIVSYQDFINATFDATQLDLNKIEREIFNLVNLERQKYPRSGIRSLRWNEKISQIAREHSKDMLEKEYFSHRTLKYAETLESVDFSQRLKDANIPYIVSNENLILLPVYPNTDIAKESIDGWLRSPGHRSTLLDLDNLYSDAGVGIACKRRLCYITMDFISLRQEYLNENLSYNYVQLIPLYPEGYGFDYNASVSIDFTSSSSVRMRLTKDKNDFYRIVNRDSPEKILWSRTATNYKDTLIISPGSYLILEANIKDTNYNLTIDYLTS
ncbi:MAG: hypothetical protein KatS3mg001_210 [Candidatus Pacearchaeota archaeon]|nr:MAG: hypothetical protein KatS3mg001_210 [Candidatus Pacearchaeota archaeon]